MKELLQKIQNVSDRLKSIEKDMIVGKGSNSYKAVSDHSVILRVKEAEKDFKIVSIPIKQELISSEIVRSNKKDYNSSDMVEKIVYVDVIKLTLKIYDLETDQSIEVESYGRGLDSGDKGFGKASTYARKYALLNAYKIATGEDPDATASDKNNNQISPKEKTIKVFNYLEKNNKYANDILTHFGVQAIQDLSESSILTIYNNLIKKKII